MASKSLEHQDITLRNTLIDDDFSEAERQSSLLVTLTVMAIGVIIGLFLMSAIKACTTEPPQVPCVYCHNWLEKPPPDLKTYQKYRDFMRNNRVEYLESQVILAELSKP